MFKKIRKIVWTIVCLFFFAGLSYTFVFAGETGRTVRVGVYPLEGFHSFDTSGNCSGYDVDYLKKISGYTGWSYEYVEASSWSEAIEMLRENKIDLLAPSQITAERLEEFGFSSFPIGKVYAAILTTKDNETVYEDYEAFNQMTFGIESGNTYAKIFEDYKALHGFEPKIVFFDNQKELEAALQNKEVDAIVANVMRASSDMKLLGKAGTAQYYYMYRKDDLKLGEELANALNQIEIADPDFQASLVTEYFPIYNEDPMTKEEIDFVKSLPTLRVGIWDDSRPISYVDEKTGKVTGMTVDLLNQISEASGISFEYVLVDRHHPNMVDFNEKQLDLMADVRSNSFTQKKYEGDLTISYVDTQAVLVSKKGEVPVGKAQKIAIPRCSDNLQSMLREFYPDYSYSYYSTVENAFKAVVEDRADFVIANQYIVDYELNKPVFENLQAVPNSGYDEPFSLMRIHGAEDSQLEAQSTLLISVLNKAIEQAGSSKVQQCIINYTTGMPYQLSFGEICYKYRIPLSVIGVLVVLICALAAHYVATRRRQMAVIRNTNTELESMNCQLEEALEDVNQASRAKSQFLAQMSHEIRTPMNAIIGLSTLIRSNLDDHIKVEDYLNKIDGSSRLLLGIINDVLDMSEIENGKLKIDCAPYDFKQAISNVCNMFYQQASQKNIQFQVHMKGVTREKIIGDELQQRLFRPFEQESASTARKHGGSGLGLAIAKELVECMNGTIQVESKPGTGTVFTVDLTFEAGEENEPVFQEEFSEIRVLVVDDDREACAYCEEILERIGVTHSSAYSGEDALEMLGEAEDQDKPFNLCLVDWKMPQMDGLELTEEIRSIFGDDAAIVVLTAYDLNEVMDRGKEAGANFFITKPLFQSEIYNVLMKIASGEKPVTEKKPEKQYHYEGKTILVVDDVALNLEVVVSLLKMTGANVVCAEDGRQALDMFVDNKVGTFDCIFMDINMPVMDGYEATKAIRSSEKADAGTVPIFAMTANAFSSDVTEALNAGMNGHIAKPVETGVLFQTLDEVFLKDA